MKTKNKYLLPLITLAFVVLVSAALYATKYQKQTEVQEQEEQQEQSEESNQEKEDYSEYFDEETRILTSPERERPIDKGRFKYSLRVPEGWEVSKIDAEGMIFSVTIERDEHRLDINHPYTDSSECIYPGEVEPRPWGYSKIDYYKVLVTSFGEARISWSKADVGALYSTFIICQKSPTEEYWKTGSKIGDILYRVPVNYDQSIIDEMNSILQSIEYTELN